MPAIQSTSKSLILVTGASGYIAAWVVQKLLEHGFNVRGTVRSPSKGQELLNVIRNLPGYDEGKLGRFEYVVVEDIAKEGALDEAVKGVNAIEHIATPTHITADDPSEMIQPALQGTVGVLETVKKYGDKVKRVVITSSCGAISSVMDKSTVFDENDWNDAAVREVEALGKDASGLSKYRASKTIAEKAVWAFAVTNPGLSWDIVTLHPPSVFGPAIRNIQSPDKLNTVPATRWYKTLMTDEPALAPTMASWVDVRDIAEAHVRALLRPEAGGNRIIISAGIFNPNWQEWLDIAYSLTPAPYTKHPLPRRVPASSGGSYPRVVYNAEKAKQLLGMSNDEDAEWKYKTMEETTKDTLADFQARGW